MPTLRLLSYNVRSLRDDVEALTRVIRRAAPHVVCVQEAPRFGRWRYACASLARRSGLVLVTGGRPAAGNLIMCTLGVDVLDTRDALFSRDPQLHRRGVALATFRWRGAVVAVAGIHLDLQAQARLRHVGELERAVTGFAAAEVPVIIAGDVNDVPGSPVWTGLAAGRADLFAALGEGDGATDDATRPVRRIDAVFADPRLRPVSARVLSGPDVAGASDHRPVLVEVEIGER